MAQAGSVPAIFTAELEQQIVTQLIDARKIMEDLDVAKRAGLQLDHFRNEVSKHIAFLENVHREYYGQKF